MVRDQSSLFPLKLVLAYVIGFTLVPDLFYVLDFGRSQEALDLWNEELFLSLVLCLPLVVVIGVAGWYFRRMRYFALGCIIISALLIVDAVASYFDQGFDPQVAIGFFSFNWAGLGVVGSALAIPFIITFLTWYFWPRNRADSIDFP